ncbi:transcription factor ETV7 isoform X1 [Oryctolagus cuniculus]|uniref:transcription factor ETV7 isoform X1 n=1 Tax=Oryctolagus cuniculus TaxID=9986 RepID=UPI0038796FCF
MQEPAAAGSPLRPPAARPPPGAHGRAPCDAQVNLPGGAGICKLPGRLRLQPALWSREDVLHWLRWAEREYALRSPSELGFQMNGRALCFLTKDDFRLRAPGSGNVLYELLQCIKTQRRALARGPWFGGAWRQLSARPSPRPLAGSDLLTEGTTPPRTAPYRGLLQQPPHPGLAGSLSHLDALALAKWPLGWEETLNVFRCAGLGSRTSRLRLLPRVPRAPRDGRTADCRLLWDFVYQLLLDPRYEPYIRWEDKDAKIFRVVDPNGLAGLWGKHKNRVNMTYEKLSRALRHYYKLNIIRKEPGQKLVFRFLKTPGKAARAKGICQEQDGTAREDEMPEVSP